MVLTNEAQPPSFLAMDSGVKLTILQRNVSQKWFGLHVNSRRDTITTHRLGISSAASFDFFRKPVDFAGPTCFHFQTLQKIQYRGFICRMFWQRAQGNLQLPAGHFGCSVSKIMHIGGCNACYHGILLVLVVWAVHDIPRNQNFMRIAGTQIWDHEEKWMTSCGTHIYLHLSISAACK